MNMPTYFIVHIFVTKNPGSELGFGIILSHVQKFEKKIKNVTNPP